MSGDQLSLFGGVTSEPLQRPCLPDQDARDRIQHDLHANLLVEAGAGAGKTTEMVRRMVALVRAGVARADQVAAVTFTRKAAAELRERFQTALEKELRAALDARHDDVAARLDAALRSIDRAFLGTIHAFCARLLRERPLDAGLDPAFREMLGGEESRERRRFWHAWVEQQAQAGVADMAALADAGLQAGQLYGLFETLSTQPDVAYPAPAEPRPDARGVRRRLEAVMDRAASHLPHEEPRDGWDRLQATLRMLRFHRFVLGWTDDVRFLDIVSQLRPGSFVARRNRWPDGDAAKALQAELVALFGVGGDGGELVRRWWAHRYAPAVAFARRAAAAWEVERVRAGTLNFHDLLMSAARLLRASPSARRELSDRYRFLLVDEFQDTDPIQADVLFLLASDEELDLFDGRGDGAVTEAQPAHASWRHLTPRPGALFVVGDPKQSIYRFRRADIALYQQVKRRFAEFGAVVELTANFRSRAGIGEFVNTIFAERFPAESTDVQAPFAPMLVQPRDDAGAAGAAVDERGAATATTAGPPAEGVFWYELDDPHHARVGQLARQDSERVAAWIAQRVRSGERVPGDFLVLTATTKYLARYAAALEARSVPVQVTGARVGGPDSIELDELRLLLRALHDPGDASLTVAVLVGLLFGIDYEQLVQHAEKWAPRDGPRLRAPFSFTAPWPGDEAAAPVEEALAMLHSFWQIARREPADIAVAEMVDRLGLLPFAAAGELGASRAGALLFALDTVRAAALNGDASLAGAIAALDAALDEADSEAPLEPGRGGAVRVMNLHKAKGLEANVVVLAMPFGGSSHVPTSRVQRDATGRATGWVTVEERRGGMAAITLARPYDWPVHEAEEQRFAHAEEQRLLYVAATRAAHELVVGCAYNAQSPSRWRSFHPWLQLHGVPITLPQPGREARPELEPDPQPILAGTMHAERARALHAAPSFRAAPVSERKVEVRAAEAGEAEGTAGALAPADAVRGDVAAAADAAAPPPRRGTDWGTAVHDALQYAAEGRAGDALRDACRNRLIALERPLDASGEPAELDELLAAVAAVLASPLWQRARAAETMLVEVPFAVPFGADEYRSAVEGDDSVPGGAPAPGHAAIADDALIVAAVAPPREIVDGRIDLAFRDADGWVIVDYKSDTAGAAVDAALMVRYRGQLALYTAAWERASGEAVKEAVLLFTATGEVVSGP
jgi:ATP-dependent helicase/nuclease subunit A